MNLPDPQSYTPDGVAVYGNDQTMLAKFFTHPQISKIESETAGRPVYKDVVMIEVIQPGEKEPTRVLATDFHKMRFPKQWENFQKGVAEIGHGTPLDHLFPNEPGTILTLNGFNVFTVEQLSNLHDTGIGNIPMGRSLVDRAKAYLSSASGGAAFHQMQAQIAALTAQLTALQEGGAPPTAQTVQQVKRGPGRPKTVEGAA